MTLKVRTQPATLVAPGSRAGSTYCARDELCQCSDLAVTPEIPDGLCDPTYINLDDSACDEFDPDYPPDWYLETIISRFSATCAEPHVFEALLFKICDAVHCAQQVLNDRRRPGGGEPGPEDDCYEPWLLIKEWWRNWGLALWTRYCVFGDLTGIPVIPGLGQWRRRYLKAAPGTRIVRGDCADADIDEECDEC